jgi:hypothetical protein
MNQVLELEAVQAYELMKRIYRAVIVEAHANEIALGPPDVKAHLLSTPSLLAHRQFTATYADLALAEAGGNHWIIGFGEASDPQQRHPFWADILIVRFEPVGQLKQPQQVRAIRDAVADTPRIDSSILYAQKNGTIRVTDSLIHSRAVIEAIETHLRICRIGEPQTGALARFGHLSLADKQPVYKTRVADFVARALVDLMHDGPRP